MALAMTMQTYLDEHGIDYEVMAHPPTRSSSETAEASHIPGRRLAKGVVMKGNGGYFVAVVPASHRLDPQLVDQAMGTHCAMAQEDELGALFPDCELGAVPVLAGAYGLPMLVEAALEDEPEVYFEGGDHTTLLHMGNTAFHAMMAGAPHARISSLQ
ncbi:MAG TPA: YbaK/EbsC family protein [Alphaproteobacteria bacterium]|jgi:Ala-tRNA(Pro) deacylase|nr:YbaK/EbsC family protein [Alphaproteobacteria bacterium]